MEGARSSPNGPRQSAANAVFGGSSEDVMDALINSAKKGILLTACKPEVKEFMHHLDVFLSAMKVEWSEKYLSYRLQLERKEQEHSSLRLAIQQKDKENSALRDELFATKKKLQEQKVLASREVEHVSAELTRLQQRFQRMKGKKISSAKTGERSKSREDLAQGDGGKDRLLPEVSCSRKESSLQSQLCSSRNEVTALQSRCLSLQDRLEGAECRLEGLGRERLLEVEGLRESVRSLQGQVNQTGAALTDRDSLVRSLRSKLAEGSLQLRATLEERQGAEQRLSELRGRVQGAESQSLELAQHLKLKEESLQALTTENSRLSAMLKPPSGPTLLPSGPAPLPPGPAPLPPGPSPVLRGQQVSPQMERKVKKHISSLNSAIEDLKMECSELKHKLYSQQSRGDSFQSQLEGRIHELVQENQQLQDLVTAREKALQEAMLSRSRADTEMEKARGQLDQLRQQHKSFKDRGSSKKMLDGILDDILAKHFTQIPGTGRGVTSSA